MRAKTEPPKLGTYTYVLRRMSLVDPGLSEVVACYGENNKQSYDITHHDEKRRRTLFVVTTPVRNRLLKLGWEDVSSDFHRHFYPPSDEFDVPDTRSPVDPDTVATVQVAKKPAQRRRVSKKR